MITNQLEQEIRRAVETFVAEIDGRVGRWPLRRRRHSLASGALGKAVIGDDGTVNARLWEIALAFAVKDALRSGDLYLAESCHHVSFWKLIYGDEAWSKRRDAAYEELRLSPEADHALDVLRAEFDQAARLFADGLPLRDDGRVESKRATWFVISRPSPRSW